MNMDSFARYLIESHNAEMQNFNLGFIAGVVVFLVLALIVRLIIMIIISNSKKSPGVKIKITNGNIFISSTAISDLVQLTAETFANIEIEKVNLLKDKNSLYIDLKIILGNKDEPFTGTAELLQSKILESLKDRFGIDAIREINVYIRKIKK